MGASTLYVGRSGIPRRRWTLGTFFNLVTHDIMNYRLLLITLLFLKSSLAQISFGREEAPKDEEESCTSPDGLPGQCLSLLKCQSILQLLKRKPIPPPVVNFLRQSVCGFTGRYPDVCCPNLRPLNPKTTTIASTT